MNNSSNFSMASNSVVAFSVTLPLYAFKASVFAFASSKDVKKTSFDSNKSEVFQVVLISTSLRFKISLILIVLSLKLP